MGVWKIHQKLIGEKTTLGKSGGKTGWGKIGKIQVRGKSGGILRQILGWGLKNKKGLGSKKNNFLME